MVAPNPVADRRRTNSSSLSGEVSHFASSARGSPSPCTGSTLPSTFAGIGRPEKFFETLRELGANLVGTRSFPDHHAFTPGELDDLGHEAARLGATLVTTEKDRVRLPPDFAADALPVSLVVKEPDFAEWLTGELTRVRASRSLRDE